MLITDFDYELPERLIAQYPAQKRDQARLMIINRSDASIEHKHFYDILDYINEGDCLVMNNSKVLPARLFGLKNSTGAKIEFLLIKRIKDDVWETMIKPGKRIKEGDVISFCSEKGKELSARALKRGDDGTTRLVEFSYDGLFMDRLEECGTIPLPPYINRAAEESDKEMYQTVYCREEGSVAAPTAGLHFTEELLRKAKEKGIKTAYVTLHVGIGTFRPVKCDVVEDHVMHFEEYHIDEENAEIINSTSNAGGKIISVGTTSTRTLESAADQTGHVKSGSGSTGIFIYPGYKFKIVDQLITNFHLPKSTLLMLVSALYDREKMLEAYKIAVEKEYRFFSYGDATFIR